MKVTLKMQGLFSNWIGSELLEIEAMDGDTISEIVEKWFLQHPEQKEIFINKNILKNDVMNAFYMIDSKLYKQDHVPSDGDIITVMGVTVGG